MTTYREWINQYIESLDWAKSNIELARDAQVCVATIQRWRNSLNHPNPQKGKWVRRVQADARIASHRAEWDKWDWSKYDVLLSEEHGISRERVRQIRQLINKPKTDGRAKGRRTPSKLVLAIRAIDPDKLKEMSTQEVASLIGVKNPLGYVSTVLGKMGVKWKKYPERLPDLWPLVNWDLPTTVLSRIWRKPIHGFAVKRMLLRSSPKWRKTRCRESTNLEYLAAVHREEEKAANYFAAGNKSHTRRLTT